MRQYAPLTSRTPPEALSPTVAAQVWARDALQLRYASLQRALLLKLLKLLLLLKEWLLLLLLLLKLLKLLLLLKEWLLLLASVKAADERLLLLLLVIVVFAAVLAVVLRVSARMAGTRVVCLSVAALVATTVGVALVAVAALLHEKLVRVTLHGAGWQAVGYIAHVLGVLLLALVRVVAILALLARGRGCLLPLTGGLIFPRRDLSR